MVTPSLSANWATAPRLWRVFVSRPTTDPTLQLSGVCTDGTPLRRPANLASCLGPINRGRMPWRMLALGTLSMNGGETDSGFACAVAAGGRQ